MQKFAAIRLVLLALLMAISHVALANHSTAHSEYELGQCVLCFGQADSEPAAVHSDFREELWAENDRDLTESLASFIFHDPIQPYHSRAPPIFI